MSQPSLSELQTYRDFAENLARQAGKVMKQHFETNVSQREKADKTIVTIADEEINQLVITTIDEAFPTHSIFGEEGSKDKNSLDCWVCDPIDGTVPYALGLAVSVFSLAYVYDGLPLVGVVYDPYTDRMYSGIHGQGAFLNGKPLQVSEKPLTHSATINIEWWPEAQVDVDTAMHELSKETGTYVLHLGSVIHAACMVASGRYEACLFPGTVAKNIDMAAVKVLVEEAGGQVTDLWGNDQRYDQDIKGALLSNKKVHQEILTKLQDFLPTE